MKILVLKFGGTSVGSIQKIKKVADIIIDYNFKPNFDTGAEFDSKNQYVRG